MAITLYGLRNCDTCRKALGALEAADRQVTFVDIRADADLEISIPAWLDAVGVDRLLNRRSTTWRSLSEEDRAIEPAALLMTHPTLIKRPVIEANGQVLVGWTKDVQAALL